MRKCLLRISEVLELIKADIRGITIEACHQHSQRHGHSSDEHLLRAVLRFTDDMVADRAVPYEMGISRVKDKFGLMI